MFDKISNLPFQALANISYKTFINSWAELLETTFLRKSAETMQIFVAKKLELP
jgi:hypothetical protein